MDFAILDFIQAHMRSPFLDGLMTFVTTLGNIGIIWIIIGVVLLFIKKYRPWGVTLLLALAVGAILGNSIIKPLVARPRPCHLVSTVELLIKTPTSYSFPSGHTCSSFIGAITLTWANRKFGYFAIPLAILIAFSRMYLYVHFPTDILGGIALACIVAIPACLFLKPQAEKFLLWMPKKVKK
jgi:undecaprenyl-diphosphatase